MKFLKIFVLVCLLVLSFSSERKRGSRRLKSKRKGHQKNKYSKHEISTALSIAQKGGSYSDWGSKFKILLSQIDNPQSPYFLKGITFNSNKNTKFVKTKDEKNKDVYYLPFRKLSKISCSDNGWNSVYTNDGDNFYRIWLDLWGDTCREVGSLLEKNRLKRVEYLKGVSRSLSQAANDYSINSHLVELIVSNQSETSSSLEMYEKDITESAEKISKFNTEEKSLKDQKTEAELALTASKEALLKTIAEIESSEASIKNLDEEIAALSSQIGGAEVNEEELQKKKTDLTDKYNKVIADLRVESPKETSTINELAFCVDVSKNGLEGCPFNQLIPYSTVQQKIDIPSSENALKHKHKH